MTQQLLGLNSLYQARLSMHSVLPHSVHMARCAERAQTEHEHDSMTHSMTSKQCGLPQHAKQAAGGEYLWSFLYMTLHSLQHMLWYGMGVDWGADQGADRRADRVLTMVLRGGLIGMLTGVLTGVLPGVLVGY